MASVVSLDPQFLVFAVLSLTVENVDSMGFVVLMWIQSALSLEIVLAESTRASFPGRLTSASWKSPVDIPFR